MNDPTTPQDRLARLTGEAYDELARWVADDLLDEHDANAANANAVAQVRLVQLLRRRGFDVETIVDATRKQPELFARYRDQIAPGAGELHTLDEAASSYGLDLAVVHRLWEATGFADQGEIGTDDDVRALQAVAVALQAGIPEDALVQLLRAYADAFTRVAEAETRLFHFHVHERLRAQGSSGGELVVGTDEALRQLQPLVEPALLYFHAKALARSVSEDIALHLAEDAGLLPPGDPTGQLPLAVAFVDLAQFTSMTQAMGDLAAAEVLDRFSTLTRRAVLSAGGRVVKQIGDEFMLVFPDAATAVRACLQIRDAAAREPSFLATRIGMHYGTVVCREGDYVGNTVNLTARITGEASSHQLLVSDTIRDSARVLGDVTFTPAGERTLKGIEPEVALYEARPSGDRAVGGTVDPVCGMTVDPAAALPGRHDGRDYFFCSRTCADRFAADPARYTNAEC
jgi:class 3 adenylate cyclase/YHS domain-containing protein